jgi:hypothetical protein
MLAHTRQVAAGNDVEDFCFKERRSTRLSGATLQMAGPPPQPIGGTGKVQLLPVEGAFAVL